MSYDRTYDTPPRCRGNAAVNRTENQAGIPMAHFNVSMPEPNREWLDDLATNARRSRAAVLRAVVEVARKYEAEVKRCLD